MKKINLLHRLISILLLTLLVGLVYLNFHTNNCNKVLTFKVGQIDERFGLQKNKAVEYTIESANLWNRGIDKKILEYSETGKVTIDFVYDERQRKTIQNNILKEKTKTQISSLDQKSDTIKIQQNNFEQMKKDYEKDAKNFETALSAYNETIKQVNSRGGATPDEFENLNQQRIEIETQRGLLENRRQNINSYLLSINKSIDTYNQVVGNVNSVIQKINENTLGEFEQGNYTNNHITLYEYEDYTTLKRLIAHELGHALGLDHTDDKNSIMYYINEGDEFILSEADILEYEKVCNNN